MFGSWEGLFSDVSLLPKFSTQEINIRTTQDEKKYPKNYFRTNISHQKGLFKESYPICLVSQQKSFDYHFKGVQYGTINFLYSDVRWPDGKP